MVQGTKKLHSKPAAMKKSGVSAKLQKKLVNEKKVKKGAPLQLPKGKFRDEAVKDHIVTKEIGKDIEQKIAAKLIQGGGKLKLMKDVWSKGKQLNTEQRRKQVTKKVGRVAEKLEELKEKAEKEGLL